MPGRIVLCPTPLGNLEDVTLRVLRCLRESDAIFAEDTRVSKRLLLHFDIRTPLRSFHQRVESKRLRELEAMLADDKTIAVVSDAGTPGISDPGAELVRAARASGALVEALPGPTALIGALVLSGFDVARFRFEGFPPRKSSARRAYLRAFIDEPLATVWYEAPNRVRALLEDVEVVMPGRRVLVLREYTKKFEEQFVGDAGAALRRLAEQPLGEFSIVLEGAARAAHHAHRIAPEVAEAMRLLARHGVRRTVAAQALRMATGASRNELYALVHASHNGDKDDAAAD
jgi:16S rRNA (cytidine1402-2'-O)-methyltransferase